MRCGRNCCHLKNKIEKIPRKLITHFEKHRSVNRWERDPLYLGTRTRETERITKGENDDRSSKREKSVRWQPMYHRMF